MFKVTEEQYFYVIYAELQQRLSSKCEVKLVGHAPFSMDKMDLDGIVVNYKGINIHLSYKEVIKELKMGENVTFEAIMVNITQKIKEKITNQFLKELERTNK